MATRRRAWAIVVGALLTANITVTLGACDSSTPEDNVADATNQGRETGSDAGDAAKGDASPIEASAGDGGGNCSPVKGPCDIVLQDCPDDAKGAKQECVVTGSGASVTTECVPVQASQRLPQGRGCCPPSEGAPNNPCLPGLTCVGQPCQDAGAGEETITTGRCSPACCKGDDQACGKSDPEGISGACDLTLVDDKETQIHNVCSYRERCKPFGVEPCKTGQMCLVEDKLGTTSCITTFGKTQGSACKFSNDCGDGLFCLDTTGDGGVCRYMCVTPNAVLPFDAGPSPETAGVGKGGCSTPQGCNIGGFKDFPAWLSFCRLPDGG